ncbi:MAG: flavin reductase family protein [bacterium]
MIEVNYNDYANYVVKNISNGAFLTVKKEDIINTMTIGWGSIGIIWGKPILMVMVRKSRYTYELLDDNTEFTVSFPALNELKKELMFCGSNSGRDTDKFKECNLNLIDSKEINTPVIPEAKLHLECKIVFKQDMNENNLLEEFNNKWYPESNYHTMYYAEIASAYIDE